MSDAIKHECGLAYVRLLKPLSFYKKKYGTVQYGLNKLYLLMEKQHNRGQDGAGVASVKLHTEPGVPFLYRTRHAGSHSLPKVFADIHQQFDDLNEHTDDLEAYPGFLKAQVPALGEVMLGHLRYGTQGKNDVSFSHPFVKRSIIPSQTITLAGNFNIINTATLYNLIEKKPDAFEKQSDLQALIEYMFAKLAVADAASPSKPDIQSILSSAVAHIDGAYFLGGILGNGHSFLVRDPQGIRPAFYYADDEIIVAASEKPAIRTVFNLAENQVQELPPATALIIDDAGNLQKIAVAEPQQKRACSFERIYFSRGGDEEIYKERKQLGINLAAHVLQAIDFDLQHTIFSFIPNTAETAFLGLIKQAQAYLDDAKWKKIKSFPQELDEVKLKELIHRKVRIEKIAIKDVKLRTFITQDAARNEMVQHVYDVTYGAVTPFVDTLVVIDDSIVRGTTLKESIITMLGRLQPKKIIFVSSSPQIRYPDCYGIDMSRLGEFVAFKAAVELLKENNQLTLLTNLYGEAKFLQAHQLLHTKNLVKDIYKPFSAEQIAAKIAQLVKPENFDIPVEVIFQTIEDLHSAIPNHTGDWYFTGNYPTAGGNTVCNTAFINYIEGNSKRSYE